VFRFGVEGFDELLGDVLSPGTLFVIAGYPGSGKTVFAVSTCYANAVRGHRCAYVAFNEDRVKLYRFMKNFNMDLEKLESEGLFTFRKLPVVSDPEIVMNELSNVINSVKPEVLVIDSVTPLIKAMKDRLESRAVLQNFFYELATFSKGLVILIVEKPLYGELKDLGDIEFVADVIVEFTYNITAGLLSRFLKVVKARGKHLTMVELPFAITPGKGIEVLPYERVERFEEVRLDVEYDLPCKPLKEYVNHLHPGHIVYVEYPAEARISDNVIATLLNLTLKYNLKTLLIAYEQPPRRLSELISLQLKGVAEANERIDELLKKNLLIVSLNPASMSISELMVNESKLLKEFKPDVVVFSGVDKVWMIHTSKELETLQRSLLLNQHLMLRRLGILTIRLASSINEELSNFSSSLADVVIKIGYVREGNTYKPEVYIWRKGRNPKVLTSDQVMSCYEEVFEGLKHANLT